MTTTGNMARDLAKLQPAPKNIPVQPSPAATAAPVIADNMASQDTNSVRQLQNIGVIKKSGAADLSHGNDFNGMPMAHPEIRAAKETSLPNPSVSGNVTIDMSQSGIFRMHATDAITITLDVSKIPAGYNPNDWEQTVVLRILNDNDTLISFAQGGTWAPRSKAPTLNKAGWYEIEVAYNYSSTLGAVYFFYPIIIPYTVDVTKTSGNG